MNNRVNPAVPHCRTILKCFKIYYHAIKLGIDVHLMFR